MKASPNGRETSNNATRYYITTQPRSGIDATAYKINSINRKIISSKTELYINNTLSHFNISNPIMTRKRQHAARKPKKRRRRRRIMARKRQHAARKPKKRRQRGGKVDIQKKLEKLGIEFHPFSLSKRKRYQYLGPGTFLKKLLARGDPGINRLDRIAKQHDIDYSNAKNLRDKWKADLKIVHAIDALPGKKSAMEKLSRNIIAAKRKFKL